jgi:hypothetical protein
MPLISLFTSNFKPIGNSFRGGRIPTNDFNYTIIPNNDLTYIFIPDNDLFNTFIVDNDIQYILLPDNDINNTLIPSNDIIYTIIPNSDGTYTLIPNNDITYSLLQPSPSPTPTPSVTATLTPTPTSTITPTPTSTPTYYYYYLLNCNLGDNKYGRSITSSLSGNSFNVDTNTCYTIVGIDLGPNYDYDLDIATLVTDCTDVLCGPTPTPTVTQTITPTASITPTPTPSSVVMSTLDLDITPGAINIIFNGVTYTSDTTISVVKNQQYSINTSVPLGDFQYWDGINVNLPASTSSFTVVTITGDTATLRANFPAPTSTPTPTQTLTPTPTPTSTPTPTPTESPLDFSIGSSCDGGGSVSVHHYTGGSGQYDRGNVLYDTESEALNETQWSTILNPNGYVGYGVGIPDITKTYWVAARDRNNLSNIIAKSILVDCAPTPTPTVTPTNTITPTPSITQTITPTPSSSPAAAGALQFYLQAAPSSGTVWTDTSGKGKNATINGSYTYVSNNGGGIKLNNTDFTGTGYISVPYNISGTTSTIEIVASFNPTSYWSTIWGNEAYSFSKGYFAYMGTSTNLIWGSPTTNTTTANITASNSIRHWVFVIDGTSKSLYLNGTLLGSTVTLNNPAGGYATNDFYFGARHTNVGTGAADKLNSNVSGNEPVFYQMRVYNTALNSSEVTTNFNEIKTTYGL